VQGMLNAAISLAKVRVHVTIVADGPMCHHSKQAHTQRVEAAERTCVIGTISPSELSSALQRNEHDKIKDLEKRMQSADNSKHGLPTVTRPHMNWKKNLFLDPCER